MATNKIAAANREFSENFQLALSTITDTVWVTGSVNEAIQLYALNSLELPPENKDDPKYILDAFMITEVTSDEDEVHRVHTREYLYTIYDAKKESLYEFHWHPQNFNRLTKAPGKPHKVKIPHLHIKIKAQDKRFKNLHKQHIPTGRVAFEYIVQFLIEECKVKPNRNEWETVLAETGAKFENDHSWVAVPPALK